MCLQPLLVSKRIIKNHWIRESISVGSLTKYLDLSTKLVDSRIGTMLPDKFCVGFDDWVGGDTHHVSVFATLPSNVPCGIDYMLLI